MTYDEAIALIVRTFNGENIPRWELYAALQEYPIIAKRLVGIMQIPTTELEMLSVNDFPHITARLGQAKPALDILVLDSKEPLAPAPAEFKPILNSMAALRLMSKIQELLKPYPIVIYSSIETHKLVIDFPQDNYENNMMQNHAWLNSLARLGNELPRRYQAVEHSYFDGLRQKRTITIEVA